MEPPTAPASAPALSARGLSKRFRRVQALASVSVDVGWGRITALVGPNGAGKSTLMRVWAGFERPTSGSALVAGHDPWADRTGAVAATAYLPQSPALYGELTVSEHLELCRHYRPAFDQVAATERMRRLALPLDQEVGRLSGGQVAQAALAIALASGARVLLLDEPLASLDPLARREFLDELRSSVRGSGTAVLLSSHVVSDVEQAADWLIVLGVGHKLLDMSLADAIATHRVVSSEKDATDQMLIGYLPGRLGALIHINPKDASVGGWTTPTVEDVVMGYLAKGRAAGSDEAAA